MSFNQADCEKFNVKSSGLRLWATDKAEGWKTYEFLQRIVKVQLLRIRQHRGESRHTADSQNYLADGSDPYPV